MGRFEAREAAFRLVYEKCICGNNSEITYNMLTCSSPPADVSYIDRLVNEIEAHQDKIKETISNYSNGFSLERIYKTDLALLFISVCEILYFEDVPDSVSANEAVELAKKYATDASPRFINGIIAAVIKNKEIILNECEDN